MKALFAAVLVGFVALPAAADPRFTITWSDADSGTLVGEKQRILFRLHNVDAPETWSRRAKCEREIELGYLAKEAAVNLTTGARLDITGAYGVRQLWPPRDRPHRRQERRGQVPDRQRPYPNVGL